VYSRALVYTESNRPIKMLQMIKVHLFLREMLWGVKMDGLHLEIHAILYPFTIETMMMITRIVYRGMQHKLSAKHSFGESRLIRFICKQSFLQGLISGFCLKKIVLVEKSYDKMKILFKKILFQNVISKTPVYN
jgi:hypothetical protein